MVVTTSKPLYGGLALWCTGTGILLALDAMLPAGLPLTMVTPFEQAPRWVTSIVGLFFIVAGVATGVAMLWRGQNLRPAITAGKLAWISLATAGFITTVIATVHHSQAVLTGLWAVMLVPVSIIQLRALLRRERQGYRQKDRRVALRALRAELEAT